MIASLSWRTVLAFRWIYSSVDAVGIWSNPFTIPPWLEHLLMSKSESFSSAYGCVVSTVPQGKTENYEKTRWERERERGRGRGERDKQRQTDRGGSPNEYSNSTVNLNLYTLEGWFLKYFLSINTHTHTRDWPKPVNTHGYLSHASHVIVSK